MNRQLFLAQPDVVAFVAWLCTNLPTLPLHLRFSASNYVKGGINQHVVGIENAQTLYRWATSWTDPQTGQPVRSDDWTSTRMSLSLLRDRLLTALAKCSESDSYKACVAVLEWGGVSGAVTFLNGLQQKNGLVKYLDDCRHLFALDGGQSLVELNDDNICRFDAGLTKIHSLIDTSGSPIYDSRVGAAIAMLYALYRQAAEAPAVLNFPSGAARGQQIRDPGELGYQPAPQFFTRRVSDQRWAQSQVELGWIIREVLTHTSLFTGTLEERCHAFESALFMLGYDLRCFGVNPNMGAPSRAPSRSTWVPTGVAFVGVLQDYAALSSAAGHAVGIKQFQEWMIATGKPKVASPYSAPLRPSEFDLPSCSLHDLQLIAQGGEAGLAAASGGQTRFIAGDELERVYLVDVFLAVRARQIAKDHGLKAEQLLMNARFAGTKSGTDGTSKLLLSLGKTVGNHFGLLQGDQPTPLFDSFFADSLNDLEAQLLRSASQLHDGAQREDVIEA